MIAHQFADNLTLNKLVNLKTKTDSHAVEWPNLLVHCSTSGFHKKLKETSLSVITNKEGEVHCKIDGRPFTVCASTFLIINPFQQLEYSTDEKATVEVTNIHFNYAFFQNLYNYFTASDAILLDDIEGTQNAVLPEFFNELHYKNQDISRQITLLSACTDEYIFEEKISEIALLLLQRQNECNRKVRSIKSRKSTTQKELYKRISMAKDIIFNSYQQPLSIEKLSQEATVSKFHFTRLFKDIYGLSPYQYLKTVRLEKAKELLIKQYSIEEVAHKVGFVESNSFINAFRSFTGEYPTEFRNRISKFQ